MVGHFMLGYKLNNKAERLSRPAREACMAGLDAPPSPGRGFLSLPLPGRPHGCMHAAHHHSPSLSQGPSSPRPLPSPGRHQMCSPSPRRGSPTASCRSRCPPGCIHTLAIAGRTAGPRRRSYVPGPRSGGSRIESSGTACMCVGEERWGGERAWWIWPERELITN